MTDQKPRADVPCNGCNICCRRDLLVLHPEMGDDPAQYRTTRISHPFTGEPVHALQHQPNGDCIYLDRRTGCTIHDRAPAICRTFDCRELLLNLSAVAPRAALRKMARRRGPLSADLLRQARRLLRAEGRLCQSPRGGAKR